MHVLINLSLLQFLEKSAEEGSISSGTVAILPINFLYEILKVYKQNIKDD